MPQIPTTAFGAFQQGPMAISLNFPYMVWESILAKFGDPLNANNVQWRSCSKDERQLILANFHERDHLVVFTSSPFGLLIWRCHQVLSRGVSWFCRKFDEAGVKEFQGPLSEWYKEKGQDELRKAVMNRTAAPELIEQWGYTRAAEICHTTMMELCDEFSQIETLLSILIGETPEEFIDWTLEDFTILANKAYSWLCKRSGIPYAFEWIPSKDYGRARAPLYLDSKRPWNALNIIEAMARYHELQILDACKGVTKRDIDWWKNNSLFGVYKPAFDFVGGMETEPFAGRALLGYSLFSCIDPATIAPLTPVAADEALPWYRLNNLKQYSMTYRFSAQKGQPDIVISMPATIQQEMEDALQQGLNNGFIGEESRWLQTTSSGPGAGLSLLASQAISETLKLFEQRFKIMLQRLRTGDSIDDAPLSPDLVFYADQARIRPQNRIDALAIHMMKTLQALHAIYALALLKEEPVVSPESILKKYVNGLEYLRGLAGAHESWNDLYGLYQSMFSREMITFTGLGAVGVNSLYFVE